MILSHSKGNILLKHAGSQYIPKITDFGMSKGLGCSMDNLAYTYAGTKIYEPPGKIMIDDIGEENSIYSFRQSIFQLLS